jgi:hypothetical protein
LKPEHNPEKWAPVPRDKRGTRSPGDHAQIKESAKKKQGTTGITTVVPYVAGQWGRGNNRLPG